MYGVTVVLVFTSVGIFQVKKFRSYYISSPTMLSGFLYLDFLHKLQSACVMKLLTVCQFVVFALLIQH